MLPSLAQDDKGLDHLAPRLVRLADHRSQEHIPVLYEGLLDLRRAYSVAGGDYKVVVPPYESEVPFVVHGRQISGPEPVPEEPLPHRLLIIPIPEHHHRIRPANGGLSPLSGG